MVEGFVKQVAWRVLSSYTLSSGKKKGPVRNGRGLFSSRGKSAGEILLSE
jgi:hypothetical protein